MATRTQKKKLEGISFTSELQTVLEKICKDGDANNDPSIEDLETILRGTGSSSKAFIPIRAISLAKSILVGSDSDSGGASATKLDELNKSLSNTKLVYTSTSNDDKSDTEYAKRIRKLKLKEQERNYSKLTANLDHSPDDDATLKSMMYAASIGANMVVAPISIGVLMYFFSGKLFSFMFPDYHVKEGTLDIRGVIAGVITGVVMLFIEMILFVIRNHEMDKFVTKKMKKEKNPFGYNKEEAKRTFQG